MKLPSLNFSELNSIQPINKIGKTVSVKDIVTENIKMQYKFGKILGEGAYGKVKLATLLADPTKVFAIKSIPRNLMEKHNDIDSSGELSQMNRDHMATLLNQEINVVLKMDHPNIVKFYQCVYDNDYINIVMEHINGKTLSDYILEQKDYMVPEEQA